MIKMKKSSLKHRKCQEVERGSEQLTLKECRKATFIHNESTHRKKQRNTEAIRLVGIKDYNYFSLPIYQ